MRRVLNRILQGNYTSEDHSLDFSCSRIELDVPAGEEYEGSFHIYSEGQVPEGKVVSSDLRMKLISDTITGTDTEVTYRLVKDYCSEGDTVKGVFSIISNMGEYYIPFSVNIVRPVPDSSVGPVKNLFHFTNLARENWSEAVELFYSGYFPYVIADADSQTLLTYNALSAQKGSEIAVEEFLIYTGKKNKVTYSSREGEISVNVSAREKGAGLREIPVEIIRDGWGYTHLNVRCEGDFLFTETKSLNGPDFTDGVCSLRLFIDPSGCAAGLHPGKIILYNSYTELEIPVALSVGSKSRFNSGEINKKALFVKITEGYVKNMLGLAEGSSFIAEMSRLTNQLLAIEEYVITAKLMQDHLLLLQGRRGEFEETCAEISELLDKNEAGRSKNSKSYVLDVSYLDYLQIQSTDVNISKRALRHLEDMSKRFRDDWRVRWLFARIKYDEKGDGKALWETMRSLCMEGSNSPVIYAEGVNLLKDDPSLASDPDRYTLQTILFGLKKGVLGEEIKEPLLFISGRSRICQPLLLKDLELMYLMSPDNRVLEETCSQLIRSYRHDRESAVWYKRAVLEDIRLTNLYENYVSSLDEESFTDIPMSVLKYFSMSNTLDDDHTASLYYYVVRHKKDIGNLYDVYKPRMEDYSMEQIRKGIITRHLASVYYEVISPASLDRNNARIFADMLFSVWLKSQDPRFVKAYVYQKGFKHPWEYKLNDGCGWVSVYGSDYVIALEDGAGNRFIRSCDYTLEKLMLPGKFLKAVSDCVFDNDRFNMYILSSIKGEEEINDGNILRYQNLSSSEELDSDTVYMYRLKILDYLAGRGERSSLVNGISHLRPERMSVTDRCELMRLMLMAPDYTPIYNMIKTCGPYFADPRYMQTFLDRQLPRLEEEDELLTASAIYCITLGKKDGIILSYLASYYRGQCKDLRNIWKMSGGYGVDRKVLEERMLIQMLYSGAFVGERGEIFEDYILQEPDNEVVRAFLLQSCYDYFVHEKVISSNVFMQLSKLEGEGIELPKVAALAYLKYYAENPKDMDDSVRKTIIGLLSVMMKNRIHLSLFQNFLSEESFPAGDLRLKLIEVLDVMCDRTIIDYRVSEGNTAVIHYTYVEAGSEDGKYKEERMREVCGGVCFKEFVLFYGESVQYYITEDSTGGSELKTSGVLRKNDYLGPETSSRFGLISDMLVSNTMHEFDTFDRLYSEYYRKEFLNSKLFKLE